MLRERLHVAGPDRIHWLFEALERGMSRDEICSLTKIDPWFIQHLEQMLEIDSRVKATSLHKISAELLLESKRSGASDEEIAQALEREIGFGTQAAARIGRPSGFQARRYLRR